MNKHHFGAIGTVFRFFRIILGPFKGHFGTILGPFWDHFGTRPYWRAGLEVIKTLSRFQGCSWKSSSPKVVLHGSQTYVRVIASWAPFMSFLGQYFATVDVQVCCASRRITKL